ncbi:hypothetical protein W04_0565 [Pseudoalteromonas sp. SW0106-04]|nr:hypothetical protein W04_0565 [Pseudoalteromonas sp. SW0106-04]
MQHDKTSEHSSDEHIWVRQVEAQYILLMMQRVKYKTSDDGAGE